MEVTLIANGLDLSSKLSTYSVTEEVSYRKIVTTLDGTEYPTKGVVRPIVTFSLFPMTDSEAANVYNALSGLVFNATFTRNGKDEIRRVRVSSNLESTFLLMSVDGKRRYKGDKIQLRGL